MYPVPFAYVRPASLEAALVVLADLGPDAKLLAGGQSLIPMLKLRIARPATLVDIGRLDSLAEIAIANDAIRVGSLVREAALDRASALTERLPILRDAARGIADPIVRNLGTIGGNIAHGDPANDHPAVMICLDAIAVARSTAGTREIPMSSFFAGPMETALRPDEILVEIRIPAPRAHDGSGYVKIERQTGDYAIGAAAVRLRLDDRKVVESRIALTNAGLTPVRCRGAERVLDGSPIGRDIVDEAAALASNEGEFWDDVRGTARYKRAVAKRAVVRALEMAERRARA